MDRVLIGGIRVFERCCWWWWLGRWWYSSPSSKAVVLEATDPKADAAKTRNFRFIFAPRLVSSPLRQNRCLFHVLRHSSVPCVSGEDSIKIGKKHAEKVISSCAFAQRAERTRTDFVEWYAALEKKRQNTKGINALVPFIRERSHPEEKSG